MPFRTDMKTPFAKNKEVWSASKLVMLMNCPRKYWFKYIRRIPEEKSFYLTRGDIFHTVTAEFLNDLDKSEKFFFERIDEEVIKAKKAGMPISDKKNPEKLVIDTIYGGFSSYREKILKLGRFRTLLFDDKENPETTSVELGFRIPIVDLDTMEVLIDVDIQGFIDLISYDSENGLSIRDHKLHKMAYSPFDMETDYQLVIYAYAFIYMYKMGCFPGLKLEQSDLDKITVGFNSNLINPRTYAVKANFINAIVTKERIKFAIKTVVEFVENSRVMKFTPNYTKDCGWKCDFKEICVAMQHGEDLSEFIKANPKYEPKKERENKLLKQLIEEETFE